MIETISFGAGENKLLQLPKRYIQFSEDTDHVINYALHFKMSLNNNQ